MAENTPPAATKKDSYFYGSRGSYTALAGLGKTGGKAKPVTLLFRDEVKLAPDEYQSLPECLRSQLVHESKWNAFLAKLRKKAQKTLGKKES